MSSAMAVASAPSLPSPSGAGPTGGVVPASGGGGDPYIRVRQLGQGSFGRVLLVRDSRSQELLVMKEIDLQQFGAKGKKEAMKEVAFLNQLAHPFVVSYREFFERAPPGGGGAVAPPPPLGKDGRPDPAWDPGHKRILYIVMEYANAGDLDACIKRQKKVHGGAPFAEEQIRDWFAQIVLALKHIHDRRILHRDIKSENIFLNSGPQGTVAKVGDFGISKHLNHTLAQAMTRIGTPYYLSPEICMNKPYNQKTDIWSLGVVLYEMCTLRHPFDATSMESLLKKIVKSQPGPINSRIYSSELRSLVDLLLSKDPRRRPSVNELCRIEWLQPVLARQMSREQLQDEFSHTMIHGYQPPLPSMNAAASYPPATYPLKKKRIQQQQQQAQQQAQAQQQSYQLPSPSKAAGAMHNGNGNGHGNGYPPQHQAQQVHPLHPGIRAVKKKQQHPSSAAAAAAAAAGPGADESYSPSHANGYAHAHGNAHDGFASEEEETGRGRGAVSRKQKRNLASQQQHQHQQQQQYDGVDSSYDAISVAPSHRGGAGPSARDSSRGRDRDKDRDEATERRRFREYELALQIQHERERELERERVKERELQKQLAAMKARAPASFPGPVASSAAASHARHAAASASAAAAASAGGGGGGVGGRAPVPLPVPHHSPYPSPSHQQHQLHQQQQMQLQREQQQQRERVRADRERQMQGAGAREAFSYQSGGGGGGGSPSHPSSSSSAASPHASSAAAALAAAHAARREEEELASIRESYQAEKAARRATRLAEHEKTRNHILPVGRAPPPPPAAHHAHAYAQQHAQQQQQHAHHLRRDRSPTAAGASGAPGAGSTAASAYSDVYSELGDDEGGGGGGYPAPRSGNDAVVEEEYEEDFDSPPAPAAHWQQQHGQQQHQHSRHNSVSQRPQQHEQQAQQHHRFPSVAAHPGPKYRQGYNIPSPSHLGPLYHAPAAQQQQQQQRGARPVGIPATVKQKQKQHHVQR